MFWHFYLCYLILSYFYLIYSSIFIVFSVSIYLFIYLPIYLSIEGKSCFTFLNGKICVMSCTIQDKPHVTAKKWLCNALWSNNNLCVSPYELHREWDRDQGTGNTVGTQMFSCYWFLLGQTLAGLWIHTSAPAASLFVFFSQINQTCFSLNRGTILPNRPLCPDKYQRGRTQALLSSSPCMIMTFAIILQALTINQH